MNQIGIVSLFDEAIGGSAWRGPVVSVSVYEDEMMPDAGTRMAVTGQWSARIDIGRRNRDAEEAGWSTRVNGIVGYQQGDVGLQRPEYDGWSEYV